MSKRRFLAVFGCGVLTLAALSGIGTLLKVGNARAAAVGMAAPSKLVDRTLVCSGIRRVIPAYPDPVKVTSIRVWTTPQIETADSRIGGYIGVGPKVLIARSPEPDKPGLVSYHRKSCRATTKRIPLSPKGLSGPPVPFEKSVNCSASPRIIVRVRALLRRPSNWIVDRSDKLAGERLAVKSDVLEAAVAVRTFPAGKPVAFATLTREGNTNLYASSRCADA